MDTETLARQLASLLHHTSHRIVFAESCTAGLVAAQLARIPGVSEVLAGSAVVYQLATKMQWLQVPEQVLRDHGAVSREVAEQMAQGVLRITDHATMAASITGHLGPGAPAALDGVAWCTVAFRSAGNEIHTDSRKLVLNPRNDGKADAVAVRHARQADAASKVMSCCIQRLEAEDSKQKTG